MELKENMYELGRRKIYDLFPKEDFSTFFVSNFLDSVHLSGKFHPKDMMQKTNPHCYKDVHSGRQDLWTFY